MNEILLRKIKNKAKTAFLAVAVVFLLAGCTQPEKSSSDDNHGALTGIIVDAVGNPVYNVIVEAEPVESTELLSLLSTGETYRATSTTSGVFTLTGLPPGDYSLFASTDYDETLSLTDITIEAKRTLSLGTRTIQLSGSISGRVTLTGEDDHSGISVFIPGTSFTAKTNSSGDFFFFKTPPGEYEIYAMKYGFIPKLITDMTVQSARNKAAGDHVLSIDSTFVPEDGTDGTDGSDGSDGQDGAQWFVGTSFPETASESDLFLDTANGNVYQLGESSWSLVTSIKGETGIDGIDGIAGEDYGTANAKVPGVRIHPSYIHISETGLVSTFSVRLNSRPVYSVGVSLTPDQFGEFTLSDDSLSFDPSEWNTSQNITVTALDDDSIDGTENITIDFSAISSGFYNNMRIKPLTVRLEDNPHLVLSESSGVISESGVDFTFTINLNKVPSQDVEVELTYEGDEFSLTPSTLTFTPSDALTPQMITVSANNEMDIEGTHQDTFGFSVTSLGEFNELSVSDMTITIGDNDVITPNTYSGLLAWYDASDPSYLGLDGSNVDTWLDKSGNDYDLTHESDAQRPTYVASGINDDGTVRFDDSYLTSIIPTQSVSGTTVFIVMKRNASVEFSAPLILRDSTAQYDTTGESLMLSYEGTSSLQTFRQGSFAEYNFPSLSDSFLHGAWFDGADTKSILGDSISDLDESVDTFGYDTIDIGWRYSYIEGFPEFKIDNPYFNGDIAEIVIYNRALTEDEFYYISGFLKHKWNL